MNFISQYAAPWALSGEPIPLHLIWEPIEDLKLIEIMLPNEVQLQEILNVKSYTSKGSRVTIAADELKTPNYFAMHVISKAIFPVTIVQKPIEFSFVRQNSIEYTKLPVTIIRPIITVPVYPEVVRIDDNSNVKDLFKFIADRRGMGTATNVDLVVRAEGRNASERDNIFLNTVRETLRQSLEFREETTGEKINIDLENPIIIHKIIENLVDLVQSGKLPILLDDNFKNRLFQVLSDRDSRAKFLDLIFSERRRILWASFLEFLQSNPQEGIELVWGGEVKAVLNPTIKEIEFMITYSDSRGNEYLPVIRTIRIEDHRTKDIKAMKAPLNVEWKTYFTRDPDSPEHDDNYVKLSKELKEWSKRNNMKLDEIDLVHFLENIFIFSSLAGNRAREIANSKQHVEPDKEDWTEVIKELDPLMVETKEMT